MIIKAAVLGLSRFADQRFDGELGLAPDLPASLDQQGPMMRAMQQLVEIVRIRARLASRPTFAASPEPASVVDKQGRPLVMILRIIINPGEDGRLRPHLMAKNVSAEGKNRCSLGAYSALHCCNPCRS